MEREAQVAEDGGVEQELLFQSAQQTAGRDAAENICWSADQQAAGQVYRRGAQQGVDRHLRRTYQQQVETVEGVVDRAVEGAAGAENGKLQCLLTSNQIGVERQLGVNQALQAGGGQTKLRQQRRVESRRTT